MPEKSMFSLEGQVALITGGNSGLGLAIAQGFRDAGAQVAITGRDKNKNAQVQDMFGEPGAVYLLDIRDEAAVEHVVDQVADRFGKLDILVNNAGTIYVGSALDHPLQDWQAVIETNLTGAFLCAKQAGRVMRQQGTGGKVINIGSVIANFGPPDFASYAASKAGLVGLTYALAVELAPYHIQVNLIEPGYFDTEMSAGLPDWLRAQIIQKNPTGRFGKPKELVGAAVFLASSASDYVTGAVLRVDGGYTVAERLRY